MTLVLTRGDVAALLTLDECIAAVEEAFALPGRSSAGFAGATRSGGRLGGGRRGPSDSYSTRRMPRSTSPGAMTLITARIRTGQYG
jgi:uncharacterized membrane protein